MHVKIRCFSMAYCKVYCEFLSFKLTKFLLKLRRYFHLLAKEITSDLIMANKRVNIDSTSTASCSKKVKKCKTRYSKEWQKKFDFIQACAKSVVGYENKFHCVCCNVDTGCAAGGTNDVLKHQETPKHIERRKSIKGKI